MRLISIISKDNTEGKYSICKKKGYVDLYYFAKLEMHYQLNECTIKQLKCIKE